MSIRAAIRAQPRYLIVTDVFAFVLVELLLVAVSRVHILLSPLAFVLLTLAAAAGFIADVAIWYWTGIRSAEISEDELAVLRGPSLEPQSFARASIARLTVRRFLGVGAVRFRTRSGQYVRISENAFPREEFRRFLAEMERWVR